MSISHELVWLCPLFCHSDIISLENCDPSLLREKIGIDIKIICDQFIMKFAGLFRKIGESVAKNPSISIMLCLTVVIVCGIGLVNVTLDVLEINVFNSIGWPRNPLGQL
mgnify:CR=1 FL=1